MRMSREKLAKRVKNRLTRGSSHCTSRCVTDPGTNRRSGPDAPTIWYAIAVPSLQAYEVFGGFTRESWTGVSGQRKDALRIPTGQCAV
jgi:hypothetical protein